MKPKYISTRFLNAHIEMVFTFSFTFIYNNIIEFLKFSYDFFGVSPQDFQWTRLPTPMKHFWQRHCSTGFTKKRNIYINVFTLDYYYVV